MTRDYDSRSKGSRKGGDAGEPGAADRMTPQMRALQHRMRLASAYNQAHPDQVEDFNRLTGGVASKGIRAIMAWQREHGLEADGKIGAETLNAAATAQASQGERGQQGDEGAPKADAAGAAPGGSGRHSTKAAGAEKKAGVAEEVVSFSDEEAGMISARPAHLGGNLTDELADQVVAGGQTGGEEKRESADAGETLGEGGGAIKEGGEKGTKAAGVAEGEGPRADILKHDAKELGASEAVEEGAEEAHGAGAKVGLSVAVRLALVPQIVHLLREHKIKEALHVVWKSVNWEERTELVKYIAEKVGGELSLHALEIFERAALVGAVADVLALGWEWTYGGLKAIAEAHEKGDRDSRIAIYAYAWSDTVMTGHHSNPGAIDAEQIEAKERGIEDGEATRELSPDLASLLLAQYGDDPDNARRALEDALLKRAGISGIRTHHA